MKPVVPDGGYFILANYSQLAGDRFQSDAEDMKDFKFVRYLTKEKVIEYFHLNKNKKKQKFLSS